MKHRFGGFFLGIVLGAVIAFPLGMNKGKNVALFSNPFQEKTLTEQVKDTAKKAAEEAKRASEQVIETTREKIHEATRPKDESATNKP